MSENSFADNVYYQDGERSASVRVPQVVKLIERYGDDGTSRGPFKLAASKVTFDTFNEDLVLKRPGGLLASRDGFSTSISQVDKTTEKIVDYQVLERRIQGLGVWAQVVGKKASSGLYTAIKVSDAIRLTLEAIGVPHGKIDDTPQAILEYWWLSDRDRAEDVLLGLAEIGGLDARLDDYDGVVSFHVGQTGTRLGIYGGRGYIPAGATDAGDRTKFASGSVGWQGPIKRRADGTWIITPFQTNSRRWPLHVLESIESERDGTGWRARAIFSRTDGNAVYTASTFDGTGAAVRPRFATEDAGNSIVGNLGGTGAGNYVFLENIVEAGQNKGVYVRAITEAQAIDPPADSMALKAGSAGQTGGGPWWRSPGESQRLVFQKYERDNEDARYFNTVRVGTITRVLQPESDVWSSPEDVQMAAHASLTIRLTAQNNTPFQSLVVPAVGTDYTVSAGALAATPTLSRISGVESDLTLRAGAAGATLQNLKVRGRLLLPGLESAYINQDVDAVAADGEIAWEGAGKVPTDIRRSYLETWAQATLAKGLERGWTATLHMLASPDHDREQWETLLRLRPGRLVQIEHSRGPWLGTVRQVERTSGADVDHVDRYKVVCELTGLDDAQGNIIRIGLSSYGNDQVLG